MLRTFARAGIVLSAVLAAGQTAVNACETNGCDPCGPATASLDQIIRESFQQSAMRGGGGGISGEVAIAGTAFNPPTLIVPAGASVVWTQFDDRPHTVTENASGGFDSGTMNTSDVFNHLFTAVGTTSYSCVFHFGMDGEIIVRLPGDANGVSGVNLDDFTILAANFGTVERTYSQGDFTLDGQVNLDDFTVLAANFGAAAPARTTVPEPAGFALVAVAVTSLRRARR